MDAWQSQPITIERKSSVYVEVRASSDGVTVIFGDGVWVSNYLLQPDDALAHAASIQEAAIQCRAMRSNP